MNIVAQIFELFATKGHDAYVGEPVSQLEHALQSAYHAERLGGNDALIVAALLHDIGHLVHKLPEDAADHGIDTRHEHLGKAWLARYFGPDVTQPIALHVPAKRYLCATDTEYLGQLSPASVQSLALQGGAFDENDVRAFERHAYFREAVMLRRCDDLAKIPGLQEPPLEHYRERMQRLLC